MIRTIILFILSSVTIGFVVLTAQRMTMDYNENGVYYDGAVTFDTDALVAYMVISCVLVVVTIGTGLVWKKKLAE